MKAFYSDTFVLPLPEHHRFPMAKYRLLRERLVEERVLETSDLRVPEPVSLDELCLAHDPDYVDAVVSGTLSTEMQRRIGFPWSEMMVERSRRSAGATLAAARAALRGSEKAARQVSANLAGGTHHSFRDRGEGYCVFNDVAIAALVLLRDGAIRKAVVVDCDVHQGNGTAAIFRDEPAVFTLSFHGEKNFPFRKEVSDRDVAFEDGPDIVFYLAGADPYEGDRLGRLKMTIDGLRQRDRFVLGACHDRTIPVAIAMSGGYAPDIDAIVTIHVNTIREAVGISSAHASPLSRSY